MMGIYSIYRIIVGQLLLFQHINAVVIWQDLGGSMWDVTGTNPPSTISIILQNTEVPGNIHTDWFQHSQYKQTEDPYYRFNDGKLSWIAEYDWKYHRNFQVKNLMNRETWLICEGLDTVADIMMNGKVLGHVNNMFVPHKFNVSNLLQKNFNSIEIQFTSALKSANLSSMAQPYVIPPECPPNVQHGYCHINLIRKEQSSFSWDWGPAFATQGIWKPIYILSFNDAVLLKVAALYDWASSILNVELQFHVTTHEETSGTVTFSIDELKIGHKENVTFAPGNTKQTKNIHIDMKNITFSKWWPNGYGEQKLYEMVAMFKSHQHEDTTTQTVKFGFRKVELIQSAINDSDGLSFYFKINDVSIFVKGSNWIPADAFLNRVSVDRYKNLLQSVKDANMNTLRVWGGGIYESDDFYDLADSLGIMLWQDFMFACGIYPADPHFLQNVSQEVEATLWRLKSHPSIIIWAGNNENEAALATDWYGTKTHFDRYKHDYIALYNDTIGKLVKQQDTSRPFLLSSPTNGLETIKEGGVSKNPYDSHYGDVHYYNYDDDCLDWTKYPKTRFASEYGFQSWPSIETLMPVTIEEDRNYYSNFSNYRQHHTDGNQQMLNQIKMHFNLPTTNQNKTVEFENLIYLTQIMQALCYKSQTEFYRRSRSELVNGEGYTMGALYWQLNDIWQAPTWSSIEFGGKWKPLHYFAKDYFAPVSLVVYNDDTQLVVYTVSDDLTPNEPVTLQIEMRQWGSFGVLHTWEQAMFVPPLASKLQYKNSIGILLHYGGCDYKELCYFTIAIKEMSEVPVAPFYPVSLKTIDGLKHVNISVSNVSLLPSPSKEDQVYEVTLTTSAPAAFVWLEAYGIKGRFSENAFLLYEPTKTIKFISWQKTNKTELKQSIQVKTLADLYLKGKEPPTPIAKSSTRLHTPIEIYWLERENIQLAWSMCGIIFIFVIASMFVCVVVRLNAPRHSKPVVVVGVGGGAPQRRKSMLAAQQILAPITNRQVNDDIDASESTSFAILTRSGYGHNAKQTEIRFHII